ncbi:MAG TPA: matrixin family metalloprotease [Fimbriimonas sp.]|nr:matrixin family metalloprotease [Fimbriimonas sp.]
MLPFLLLAVAAVPAPARMSVKTAPVLPEVNKQLEDGRADVENNTLTLAMAHAQLVLLGSEIKYSVLFQGVSKSQQAGCLRALKYATGQWKSLLDGALTFTQIPDGQPSNIVVRFRPTVVMKGEQVAGYVNWKRSVDSESDGSVHAQFNADLQIRVKELDGGAMPENAMRHAVMHEMGHVLGLDDSPNVGDVMGPLDIAHPVAAPTALEVQTVKSLRAEAAEIIQKATPIQ